MQSILFLITYKLGSEVVGFAQFLTSEKLHSGVSLESSLARESSCRWLSTAPGDAILPTTPSSENISAILSDSTAIIASGDEGILAGPKLDRVGPQPLRP